MLKRALIVGASSGIGEALAKVLARDGHHVALVARRLDRLEAMAEAIRSEHPDRTVVVRAHDVRDYEAVPALFEGIVAELDGLDVVVYASGVMPLIEPDEYDTGKDALVVQVNVTGAIAWLNEAAKRFGALGAGKIVGISSVAGDRGRKGFPAYCASKAALTTYLESLRNRLGLKGVDVITIKPGPVATEMTEGRDGLPMLITAQDAAEQIGKAIASGQNLRYVPIQWMPIMTALRHVPSAIFRRLSL